MFFQQVVSATVNLSDRLNEVLVTIIIDPLLLLRSIVYACVLRLIAGVLLEELVDFHLDLLVPVCFHGPIKILNISGRIPRPCRTLSS